MLSEKRCRVEHRINPPEARHHIFALNSREMLLNRFSQEGFIIISEGGHPPHIVFPVGNRIVLMIDDFLPASACRTCMS